MSETRIEVEVAFARESDNALLAVSLPQGATLRDAVEQCGMLERFPDIDLSINKVGVFGKAAKLDRVLESGDRVEIYAPLIADPKAARKKRAAEGKVMKKGAAAAGDKKST